MEINGLIRAESVVSRNSMQTLLEAIENITRDMTDDGFEYPEVKEFIQIHLDEILGK